MFRLFKAIIATSLLFSVSACRVDELSPCDGEIGIPGLLCKEYRFQEGTSIGSLSYLYNKEGVLNRIDFNSISGEVKKSILLLYEDDRLIQEIALDDNGKELDRVVYNYNEQNNIAGIDTIEGGIVISNRVFEYENAGLQKESVYQLSELISYVLYDYLDDGTLFRKRYYNGDGSLERYELHEYFDNYFARYKYYTALHLYLGYDLEQKNSNGQVIKYTSYTPTSEVTNYIEYSYNELYQLAEEGNYDEEGGLVSNTVYKYYLN